VGPRSFRAGRGELHQQLSATLAALGRNRAARNRQQAARVRHDMRTWQVERRKRTRHLIELGGLVVKARVVDLTGDDRATILGALLWMADKLQSDQSKRAMVLWAAKGKQAFEASNATEAATRDKDIKPGMSSDLRRSEGF
jgi:Conjugal transfer protein TraD